MTTTAHKKTVLHIITSLNRGGAETMLLKLLKTQYDGKYRNVVLTILDEGGLRDEVRKNSDQLMSLDIKRLLKKPNQFVSLYRELRRLKPDLIHGWMYHGCLVSTVLSRLMTGKSPVLWNIRCSKPDPKKWTTALVYRVCVWLSGSPGFIIVNSHAGMDYHRRLGYKMNSSKVIGNGIDQALYRPVPDLAYEFRRRFHIPDSRLLIGILANYRAIKDYPTFLKAAEILLSKCPHVHFVAGGQNINHQNLELTSLIAEHGLDGKITLCDEVEDVNEFMNSLDIFSLTSLSEGFPNVVLEAMATGTPCVTTDAGDCREIIGETGLIVATNSPAQLAFAWEEICAMSDKRIKDLGEKSRNRVIENYSIRAISNEYESVYSELAD